jgi:hypothetical protein
MISSERQLILAVYVIYLVECLHWLSPGEVVITRKITGGWRRRKVTLLSFTLLGSAPLFLNPIDFRGGLVRVARQEERGNVLTRSDKGPNRACSFGALLPVFCGCGAVLFLVVLPVLAASGWLPSSWIYLVSAALSVHVLIVLEFFDRGRFWRTTEPRSFWKSFASLCLNPLAAVRAGDVLFENTYRIRVTPRKIKDGSSNRDNEVN